MPKKVVKSAEGGPVLLQQKAQAVDEMVQKEKLLTLFLKDKLQKEQRNTAVNRLKLIDTWRTILRQTCGTKLQAEADIYRQTFEKQLDNQDSIIEKMLQELQEAELQLAQLRHAHVQHLEHLQVQKDKRLKGLEEHWDDILEHTRPAISAEREWTLAGLHQQQDKLQSLKLSTEQRHKEEKIRLQQIYDDCQVDHEDLNLMLYNVTDDKALQKKLLSLQKLIFLLSERTEKNNRSKKTMERLQAASKHLKGKLVTVKSENKSHLEDMKATQDELNRTCHQLQDWLNQTRSEAKKQLTRLTVQGDSASKTLQAAINKGETVLRMADLCSKLETQLNISSPPSSLPSKDSKLAMMAHAKMHRQAARQHRDALYQENQQLRFLISQQLENATLGRCINVSQAPTTNILQSTDRCHIVMQGVHAMHYAL